MLCPITTLMNSRFTRLPAAGRIDTAFPGRGAQRSIDVVGIPPEFLVRADAYRTAHPPFPMT